MRVAASVPARWRAALMRGVAGVATLVALIGAAHLPWAQRALARAPSAALRRLVAAAPGCPLGFGGALGAADRERALAQSRARLRGPAPSPQRPSLGFALDVAQQEQVTAWATGAGGTCQTLQPFELECRLPVASALPAGHGEVAAGTVSFSFAGDGRLVRVRAAERLPSAGAAVDRLATYVRELTAAVGAPSATVGELSAAYLGAGALRQARHTYAFADYHADLEATHMGGLGYFAVQRTFRSLRAPTP